MTVRQFITFNQKRILGSFQPWKNEIDVDIYGSVPILLLFITLSFIPDSRVNHIKIFHPFWVITVYHLLITTIIYLLSKLGKSRIKLIQVFGLVGYAFYAHFFLSIIYLLLANEISALCYFILVTIFLGLSTAKLLRIFLSRTRVVGMRLLVCSAACICNVLFFLFIFLVYVHPDYSHPSIKPKSDV